MGLLGAFIYKRIKSSVQGEVPAHRMALPATTFNHSPRRRRVAITQVLLENKFETLCYSSLLAHTMLSNKGNLQSSLKRVLARRSDYINYDHGGTKRLLLGPAGNSSFRPVLPPGELMRLLGAFIYKQIKCSVQGEVPARRVAHPAATFNHSPLRVAITQVLLKNKFETLCCSSLPAHTMLSN